MMLTATRSQSACEDSGLKVFKRRAFLRRGGLVASGAALGTAMHMSAAGAQVEAQVIDFVYAPVGPVRVYDSRLAEGPLLFGQTRILTTGLQNATPRPLAVTVNLTVTLTHQKGWLALFPGDVAFPGTSSINWFGDFQDLANNAFVRIPDDGTVQITCGGVAGAQADFVIDFIGESAPFDLSPVSAADAGAFIEQQSAGLGSAPWVAQ